jgi:hypothetical protein
VSYSFDEQYDVYDERVSKARKAHVCSACERSIDPGQLYVRVRWVYDGSADGVKRCGACQLTHEHLRGLGRDRDMWPDETLSCGLEYYEEWDADPPDGVAALPFLTAQDASDLLWGRRKRMASLPRQDEI